MNTIEFFLFGLAAVIDLALLLALWERINRGRVAVWLLSLVASMTVIHVAIFTRLMIGGTEGYTFQIVDRLMVMLTCAGLLWLPSAMLHAAIRLHHTGIDPYPPADHRYVWLYAPMLAFPFIAYSVWHSVGLNFMAQVGGWRPVYLGCLVLLNSISTVLFLRLRRRERTVQKREFLLHLSLSIVAITSVAVVYATIAIGTKAEGLLRLLAIISPLAAAVLFIWHSMRGRLLPLVMERTFLYAVGLISLLLIHRLLLTPILGWLESQTNVDFFLVEGIIVTGVILCVPSLRMRFAESLRHLFSTNVAQVRHAIRQLALKLSQNASLDSMQLVEWFASELRSSIELEYVTILLVDEAAGEVVSVRADQIAISRSKVEDNSPLWFIYRGTCDQQRVLELGSLPDPQAEQAFTNVDALLAYRLSYRSINGMVLLGNRIRNDRLARDQVYVLSIVIDQLAATLHHRREELLRQRAERKILQQEKLSVLGLLAGSLAHELRNPLSSIRAITTLVMEDLGDHAETRRELQMVIDEMDRLTVTTNRLLDYSRPESQSYAVVDPHRVILRIMHVLEYLASQCRVETRVQLTTQDLRIEATDAAFSEIVFNLVKNAIEAARDTDHGRVEVSTRGDSDFFRLSICDNGKGVPEDRQASLFQPFATSKVDGNGLGLYAVGERVRELGGTVTFRAHQPCGTVFEVQLPRANRDEHPSN